MWILCITFRAFHKDGLNAVNIDSCLIHSERSVTFVRLRT